jgi:hypothetical protein
MQYYIDYVITYVRNRISIPVEPPSHIIFRRNETNKLHASLSTNLIARWRSCSNDCFVAW